MLATFAVFTQSLHTNWCTLEGEVNHFSQQNGTNWALNPGWVSRKARTTACPSGQTRCSLADTPPPLSICLLPALQQLRCVGNVIRKERRTFLMCMSCREEVVYPAAQSFPTCHWHVTRGKSTTGESPVHLQGDAPVSKALWHGSLSNSGMRFGPRWAGTQPGLPAALLHEASSPCSPPSPETMLITAVLTHAWL